MLRSSIEYVIFTIGKLGKAIDLRSLPPVAAVALGAVLIIRHKDNIRRLLSGTESKIK
jgi:glycerol-3-phosphate acyltransferase PlsY